MEFGKKGDAKKAMKLHHKEGITLKQAWKRVKSGGKSPSRSRKASPKRTKVQNMAKKAMKLHHKEGITLKQAWKRVSKFGMATVCADGYEANQLWTPDSRRNQCIKTCGFYEMRDPVTNRCKKMIMAGQTRAPLKPGYEINPDTGRMRKMCLPGYYRDPVTKRCRKIGRGGGASVYKGDDEPDWLRAAADDVFSVSPLLAVPPTAPFKGTLGFGRRFKKCGFGTCSACALKK